MKFGQSFSIRKHLTSAEFATGLWNPDMTSWREVVENYLYISRKSFKDKLCMFKLQLNILQDIVVNIKAIDEYKLLEIKSDDDEKNGRISKEQREQDKKHFNSEIFKHKLINKVLREIVDGMVWKYLKYNRAILYMLADKQPIEVIRPDAGTDNNLREFGDAFQAQDATAIYNDITNFLRVGDVTQFKEDGSIEIIEVKAREKRGGRITRQKEKMSELVEFFNSGFTNFDGKKVKIINSKVKQRTYLSQLRDSIHKARQRGYESMLIGKYLILEIVDFKKARDVKIIIDYFQDKHKTVKDEWKRNEDFVSQSYLIDKMDYSKNCAPFSIYPFDIETCTDIMMGRLAIAIEFNYSEMLRIIERSGWKVVDSIFSKTQQELESLLGKEMEGAPFLTIIKDRCRFEVPPALFARIQYELLAPSAVLEEIEEFYNMGPQTEFDYGHINYIDEKRNWI